MTHESRPTSGRTTLGSALGGVDSETRVRTDETCDCQLDSSLAQRLHDFWRDFTYQLPGRHVERPRFDVHEHHEDEHGCFVCRLLAQRSA